MNHMMQGLLSASLSGTLMLLVFYAGRYLLRGRISSSTALIPSISGIVISIVTISGLLSFSGF